MTKEVTLPTAKTKKAAPPAKRPPTRRTKVADEPKGLRVVATLDEGHAKTIVTVTGCGLGDHEGYLLVAKAEGAPLDFKRDLRWSGNEVVHTFEFVTANGIAVVDESEEVRFDGPVVGE